VQIANDAYKNELNLKKKIHRYY